VKFHDISSLGQNGLGKRGLNTEYRRKKKLARERKNAAGGRGEARGVKTGLFLQNGGKAV